MDIIFADEKLKKYANDYNLSQRKMGDRRAKLYQTRIQDMYDIESFADLANLPGRFHPLTANRSGQWACDLDHPYRLIFEPGGNPLPKDEKGNLILKEIKIVEIQEITNYHGK